MSAPTKIKIGSWTASPALNLLENGEQSVKLESRTMDVLVHLARRPGEVVSVDELLGAVWQGVVVTDSSAYQAIKQLRQALGGSDDGAAYIETIPKRGYRLVAPVENVEPAPVEIAAPEPAPVVEARDTAAARPPLRRALRWLEIAAVIAAAVLAAVLGRWSAFRGNDAAPLSTSFAIAVDGMPAWELGTVAVAPNGRYIAYVAGTSTAPPMLYVRPRDSFEARVLPGTEGARGPFWSPDSSQIGFRSGTQLKRIALLGGEPQTIADIGNPPTSTGTWGESGDILFDGGTGIERVPASGGVPVRVTALQSGEGAHTLPFFLPGGRRFLYTSIFKEPGGGVYVQSLDSGERTLLVRNAAIAAYASGYLLLGGLDATLTAQRLDVDTLTLGGQPVRVAEHAIGFSVSNGGVLAYKVGNGIADAPSVEQRQLAWYDLRGTKLANVGAPGPYRGIALSRDGRYAAVHRHDGLDSGDIWVLDLERDGLPTRRTFDGAHNIEPVWSPDGADLIYTGASLNLYRTPAAGGDAHDVVLGSARFAIASDWSSDGAVLVTYTPATTNHGDIGVLTVATGALTPVLATEFAEGQPKLSPDRRWLAYLSDTSGRYEVYVRQFPRAERQTRISAAGGVAPLWSADGSELFYLAQDGTVMAVAVHASGDAIEVEVPRPLFKPDILFTDHPSLVGELPHWPYALSPDGERFLVNERVRDVAPVASEPVRGTIAVVIDWPSQIAR